MQCNYNIFGRIRIQSINVYPVLMINQEKFTFKWKNQELYINPNPVGFLSYQPI